MKMVVTSARLRRPRHTTLLLPLTLGIFIVAFVFWSRFSVSFQDDEVELYVLSTRKELQAVFTANATESESYDEQLARLTIADPSQKTLAYAAKRFVSGYVNEVMVFTAFVMYAMKGNFTQILLPTLKWRDLFGSNKGVPHEMLFDVVHWNKFYATPLPENNYQPPLPRLVALHTSMTDYNPRKKGWVVDFRNATNPYGFGFHSKCFTIYKSYRRDNPNRRDPVELAMIHGAYRPHPDLQKHIDQAKASILSRKGKDLSRSPSYLCFHARIEPDMQMHRPCYSQKVVSLEQILNHIYTEFPTPPVDRVLIVLYRKLLEDENKTENEIAGRNLETLNKLIQDGMWNGTVPVYEAGPAFLPTDSFYAKKASSIAGSILNYNLALDSDIFIGSPVSSYAMHAMATKYNRKKDARNFLYLPEGLKQLPSDREPPRFTC